MNVSGGHDDLLADVRLRGPLSAELRVRLTGDPIPLPDLRSLAHSVAAAADNTLTDEDVQLSLWIMYELHYRGFSDVADRWEWHSDLVAATDALEVIFEQDLRALVAPKLPVAPVPPAEVAAALAELVRDDDSPSMSKHLARHGTRVQYAEFLAHRSIYHLKEADPHAWVIPRLRGGAKAALVAVEFDEFGAIGAERRWPEPATVGRFARAALDEFGESLILRKGGGGDMGSDNLIFAMVARVLADEVPRKGGKINRKEVHRLLDMHLLPGASWRRPLSDGDPDRERRLWDNVKKVSRMEELYEPGPMSVF